MTVPEGFKDRRTGLILFGVLNVALGIGCLLLTAVMAVGLGTLSLAPASAAPGVPTVPLGSLAFIVLFYLGSAAALIWLGAGSILTRRWARSLLLILHTLVVIGGIMVVGMVALMLPGMLNALPAGTEPIPPTAQKLIAGVTLVTTTVLLVVVPGVMVLFYRSRHVKATVESYDATPRWTDACPQPILTLSLLLVACVVSMPPALLQSRPVVPFFGWLLSGGPALVVLLALFALWLLSAWDIYRLRPRGWWVLTVTMGLGMVSALMTFARLEPIALYQAAGYPPEQLRIMQQVPLTSGVMLWAIALTGLPFMAYLVSVRKYFR